ncbi:response regulator [Aquincola sp. S2]|uniref:histidine kinase n=1 Tax=Pseudaquabacterium terrae TaxID=2732868 RepID=A0ABX2EIL2_9BURK|nr:response regulator [Aquabacterium terrae]NRF68463.1 response regulator [Aquabacterium terrae]
MWGPASRAETSAYRTIGPHFYAESSTILASPWRGKKGIRSRHAPGGARGVLTVESSGVRQSGGRILVVDDSANDLQFMVRMLRGHGYTPHATTDARLAFAFLRETLPDLILLDVHLVDTDGYEICRQLKANAATRDVPVIFVSGESGVLDRVRAFSVGAVDYIIKPLQEEEALARIETHLALRRLAASLTEAKERAEEASRAKSQFLASMSHELRTPLNAILGYAQILQMDEALDARQHRAVDAVRDSGEHLLHLIDDILDLARIEAGRLQLVPAPASLSLNLHFVTDAIRVRAEPKGLAFSCEMDELPAMVMVDEKRLSQVLLNLLGNAVKFTARGEVRLRVQALPTDDADTVTVRFSVEDTGPGISPEDAQRLFRAFEQAGPTSQQAGGTGLGLAISKRIVEAMGGDLLLESALGKGSRFWFDLQLSCATGQTPVQIIRPMPRDRYAGPRKSVLVVDDVWVNRDVAARALALAGFDTIEAGDGLEAVDMVRSNKPDLVVMDILMPFGGGLEAIKQLRQSPETASLPIIAVSASSYEADVRKALEAGADRFLPKPVDFDDLLAAVTALLHVAPAGASRVP